MTVQSGDALGSRFQTLAERLRTHGYRTTGFCNNPLVGVLNNGFKRGFETFYNYGGAIPSLPTKPPDGPLAPLHSLWARYTQLLRRIAYPIQNAFANSGQIFQAALNPLWVPLWTRFARFKGDTPGSIHDVSRFIREDMGTNGKRPSFLFVNLMETHLPYSPPDRFANGFAPQMRDERAARDFLRSFNSQAMHWITPGEKPFSELEARTLSDMYDAEVAYQDHLLAEVFEALDQPKHRANTLVVLVADHGEMLGEHGLMGHAFGVYQELVHVPLVIRFPGQVSGQRVAAPISTTRLFHTLLDVAGIAEYDTPYSQAVDVKSQSLVREMVNAGRSCPVVTEAYPPGFALEVMEAHKPDLLRDSNWRATWRAVYADRYKLIDVENVGNELFSLDTDPQETHGLQTEEHAESWRHLVAELESFVKKASSRRLENWEQAKADLDDELVRRRLRDLGYLE
jgi:uncharacterized sulfatase